MEKSFFSEIRSIKAAVVLEFSTGDHQFRTYEKFYEKLTFFIPRYAHYVALVSL